MGGSRLASQNDSGPQNPLPKFSSVRKQNSKFHFPNLKLRHSLKFMSRRVNPRETLGRSLVGEGAGQGAGVEVGGGGVGRSRR